MVGLATGRWGLTGQSPGSHVRISAHWWTHTSRLDARVETWTSPSSSRAALRACRSRAAVTASGGVWRCTLAGYLLRRAASFCRFRKILRLIGWPLLRCGCRLVPAALRASRPLVTPLSLRRRPVLLRLRAVAACRLAVRRGLVLAALSTRALQVPFHHVEALARGHVLHRVCAGRRAAVRCCLARCRAGSALAGAAGAVVRRQVVQRGAAGHHDGDRPVRVDGQQLLGVGECLAYCRVLRDLLRDPCGRARRRARGVRAHLLRRGAQPLQLCSAKARGHYSRSKSANKILPSMRYVSGRLPGNVYPNGTMSFRYLRATSSTSCGES